MNYKIADEQIGLPAVGDNGTTQKAVLGLIARIQDADAPQTVGEAVYVKSNGAILDGSMCKYDPYLGTADLMPVGGQAATGQQAGVALGAIPSGSYGWLQITGNAKVKAPNAMVVGAGVWMLAATPGSVDDALVAGAQVLNAKVTTTTGTPAAGFAIIQINRPSMQSNIT